MYVVKLIFWVEVRVIYSQGKNMNDGVVESQPPNIDVCKERIQAGGVWWQISSNFEKTEAFSCSHAAKFRERLGSGGNGGIPLWAELKSLLGIAIDPTTKTEIPFAAHTRANTEFNDRRILDALGLHSEKARIKKVFNEQSLELDISSAGNPPAITKQLSLSRQKWFGRVNPFNVDLIFSDITGEDVQLAEISQIMDRSLELDGGVPNTIMSNLGCRTMAFEMRPSDLISLVKRLSPKSFVGPIATPSSIWLGLEGTYRKDYWLQFPPPKGPKIGILTGNSPESGITLWQDMLSALREAYPYLPDSLMPEVFIHSMPGMGLSMELASREQEVRSVVQQGIMGLLKLGCGILTIACNTTIYYEPEITKWCEESGARFVSIAEACMPAVRRALKHCPGKSSVGLVGIGPVVDMTGTLSGYKRHLEAEGIRVTPCPADRLAFAVKSKGTVNELVTDFRRLVNSTLPKEDVVVILALTEVSMIYRDHLTKSSPKNRNSKKFFIDPLLELGKFLSYHYLRQGYLECSVCQIPEGFDIDEKLSERHWGASSGSTPPILSK
jgi:aspartate/glutamate racemase